MTKQRSTPAFDLNEIRELAKTDFIFPGKAERCAAKYGYTTAMVQDFLTELANGFFKSMESEKIKGEWQDVYRPYDGDKRLYIKLTIIEDEDGRQLKVTSFTEDGAIC